MSSFTDRLEVVQIGADTFATTREFTYYVGEEWSKDKIVVPKGFITDFASVPFPASMFIPKSGLYNQAAVLHDFLYQKKIRSRKESDQIFLEAMKVLGVNVFKRNIMYRAVRAFGWVAWRKDNDKKSEGQ